MNAFNHLSLANSAIENYSGFSNTQKQILKTIIQFENAIPTDVIINITQITRQAFQFSIKRLLEEEYVTRKKVKVYLYQINNEKLSSLIETHKIQKALLK